MIGPTSLSIVNAVKRKHTQRQLQQSTQKVTQTTEHENRKQQDKDTEVVKEKQQIEDQGTRKRGRQVKQIQQTENQQPRKRGRPVGSKNKPRTNEENIKKATRTRTRTREPVTTEVATATISFVRDSGEFLPCNQVYPVRRPAEAASVEALSIERCSRCVLRIQVADVARPPGLLPLCRRPCELPALR